MRLLSQQASYGGYFEPGVAKAIAFGCGGSKNGNASAVLKAPGAYGSPTLFTTYQNVPQPQIAFSSPPAPKAGFDLTEELSTLRRDLEKERSRSRAVAERLRSDLQAIDAEIKSSGSSALAVASPEQALGQAYNGSVDMLPSQFGEDEWQEGCSAREFPLSSVAMSSQDLPLMIAKLDSDASTTADALQAEGSEQATAAATALARALHEGVRSLMEQGMEFRALAVRREASLKAALEASERARLEAEEKAVSSSGLACRSSAAAFHEEEINLAIAEQEICEALVGRLQAQVRTLEMQIECMDCELKAARTQAAEWELRHQTALVTIQHMQQDSEKALEPHEMPFKQRRALFQRPEPAPEEPPQRLLEEELARLSAELSNRNAGSPMSPTRQRAIIEGCGVEGVMLSPSVSPSSPLVASVIGSRTPPMKARPLAASSQQCHSPSLQQPSWTVAGRRTALCAEVKSSRSSPSPSKEWQQAGETLRSISCEEYILSPH
jgi:hypothetical protein